MAPRVQLDRWVHVGRVVHAYARVGTLTVSAVCTVGVGGAIIVVVVVVVNGATTVCVMRGEEYAGFLTGHDSIR